MTPPAFDPRDLNLLRFAAAAGVLEGRTPAAELQRLAVDAPPAGAGEVRWAARGERRGGAGREPETWLHLQAHALVRLTCQRCLQPMEQALHAERSLRFVADEAEAERLDELSEDDVLALPPRGRLDLQPLIEDELILALPIVPRHEDCPEPLPLPVDDLPEEAPENPFQALAALKRKPS
jgi:uncharacterized protein